MKNIEMLKTVFQKVYGFELNGEAKEYIKGVCYGAYDDKTNYLCAYDEENTTEEGQIIIGKLQAADCNDCKNCYFNDWQEREYTQIKHIIVEFKDEANKALFDKIKGKCGFCLSDAEAIEKEKLFKLEEKPEAKIYYIYFFEKDGKLFADYATEEGGSFALVFEKLEASEE